MPRSILKLGGHVKSTMIVLHLLQKNRLGEQGVEITTLFINGRRTHGKKIT